MISRLSLALSLAALLLPARLPALPAPVRLPSGLLLARSDDASYDVAPDGGLVARRGLLSFYHEGVEPLWPTLEAPERVVQGRLFAIPVVTDAELSDLRAEARLSTGRSIAAARGFELPASAFGPLPVTEEVAPSAPEAPVHVYVLLLSLPLGSASGPCLLEVSGSAGSRRFSSTSPLEVLPAAVVETRVALDATLTALRTRSDARTIRDQKLLDQVLATFTPSAVYGLEAMRVPVPNAVGSAAFGDRRVYEYAGGGTALSVHRGVDLVVAAGTEVAAAARGRVVLAEGFLVTGNTVAIEHLPGLISFCFHLSSISVSVGQLVEPGQSVGRVGATGLATGPHLHWEIRCAGVEVDPRSVTEAPLVDKSAILRIIAAYRTQDRRR